MEAPPSFGDWLRQRRKALGLTREQLAQRVGCSVSALRKLETGERRPSSQVAELLAHALQLPPEARQAFVKVGRGQLSAERLPPTLSPATQPAPVALPARPVRDRLPSYATPLIGREPELAELGHLLPDPACRLLTLTGPGGIGKTRLAVRAAELFGPQWPDGATFVALAPLTSASFIVPAIAQSLGFSFSGPAEPGTQLGHYLRDKHLLLVLDNAEHLLTDGAAEVMAELLGWAPGMTLLVTSREVLDLRAEWVFDIQGLPVPRGQLDIEAADAVGLFVQRARRADVGFTLATTDHAAVVRICQLVDGMPLAIELAASWVRTLPCAGIVAELEHNLGFLSTSARDVPARHRSMQAAFDHSWKLLLEEEQGVLRQLSVFRGSFTREAAVRVAGASLGLLSSLASKSLIRRATAGRYDLHELLRQYADARLGAEPEVCAAAHARHYAFFLALAEAAEPHLKGSEQVAWLDRLEQEHDNLRAALEWSLTSEAGVGGGGELALRLATALGWYWYLRANYREGLDWLLRALALRSPMRTALHARAWEAAALLNCRLGNCRTALSMAEEAAAVFGALADNQGLAGAITAAGLALEAMGETPLARGRFEEALSLYREAGNHWGTARGLTNLGGFESAYGDRAAARTLLEAGVAIFDELGDQFMLTYPLCQHAELAFVAGDYGSARAYVERSLAGSREIRDPEGVATALTLLGQVLQTQGDYAAARASFAEALAVNRARGSPLEATALCGLVETAIAVGDLSTGRLHLLEVAGLTAALEIRLLKARVQLAQGLLAHYEGDTVRAAAVLEETAAVLRALQERTELAAALVALGNVKRAQGNVARAALLLAEGLELYWQTGDRLGVATALEGFAGLVVVEDAERAARLFGTAEAMRAAIGAPLPPVDHRAYAQALSAIRTRLDERTLAGLWAQGQAMRVEDAVAYALRGEALTAADHDALG